MTMMLNDVLEAYLNHLKRQGLSEKSLYNYGKDSQQVQAFFGESSALGSLTRQNSGRFLKSDDLRMLPSGKECSERTFQKTIGFFRRFVEWCIEQRYLAESPLPKAIAR